jgi:hypothetical protein
LPAGYPGWGFERICSETGHVRNAGSGGQGWALARFKVARGVVRARTAVALSAAILLAGCGYHSATCTNVSTGEVVTGETQPGTGVGISGYIVRDHNGIEGRIDGSNSADWRCKVAK